MDDDRRESGMDSAFVALEGAARIDESTLALQAPARAKRRASPRAARVELPAAPAPLAVEAARAPEVQPVSSAEEPVVKSKRKGRRGASLPLTAAEDRAAEPAAEASSAAVESAAEAQTPTQPEPAPQPEAVVQPEAVMQPQPEPAPQPAEGSASFAAEAGGEPGAKGNAASAGEPVSAHDEGVGAAPAKAKKKRGRKADASADLAPAQEAPRDLALTAEAAAAAAELAAPSLALGDDAGAAISALEAGVEPELAAEASGEEAGAAATSAGGDLELPAEESGLERIEDRQLLAVLFGSPEELTVPRLAEILGWKRRAVEQRLPRVRAWLDELVLPFELRLIAGGWRLVSRSEYAELLGRLRVVRRRDRLSQAALEVLSVVAYKQPVPASEVDRIRGVNCSSILRLLLDRELVHVVGRQDSPGRPLLYGTTKLFLDRFGLGALHDLPGIEVAHDGYAAADDIAPEDLPSAEDSAEDEVAAIDAEPAADGDPSASASETSA